MGDLPRMSGHGEVVQVEPAHRPAAALGPVGLRAVTAAELEVGGGQALPGF